MSILSSSKHVQRIASPKHPNIHRGKKQNYEDLQSELHRLRTALTHETTMAQLIAAEPELFPDPIEQAAAEHDLDVALSVKLIAVDKLRRIEQALTSLHARSYGICSRCGHDIPYARLKVQPDSLYCVPCLTVIEQNAARN